MRWCGFAGHTASTVSCWGRETGIAAEEKRGYIVVVPSRHANGGPCMCARRAGPHGNVFRVTDLRVSHELPQESLEDIPYMRRA